jgi:hypothetical protein
MIATADTTSRSWQRLSEGEKRLLILRKIKDINRDFNRYCRKNLKILDKAGELVQFKPNPMQQEVVDYVMECIAKGVPVRVIILKARQQGMSTVIEAIIYWWTATHKRVNAKIISHDDESAGKIATMFKRYYDNSHYMFKPMKRYNTKDGDLTFANPKRPPHDPVALAQYNPGLESMISTASSRNTQIGRGDTIRLVHGSEVAFWPDGESLVAGLGQTVPYLPGTMVFLESTANGVGGYFYDEWQAAVGGNSNYKPFFFPWFDFPEYKMAPAEDFVLTPEERVIRRTHRLTKAQMCWRRMKMRDFKDKKLFMQEYPATDLEAFISSGRPRFDMEILMRMKQIAEETPVEFGYFEQITKGLKAGTYKYVRSPEETELKIWKHPVRLADYTIGADVAEGLETGDFSTIEVADRKTGETVARWRGHCDPDALGYRIYELALYYNRALVGVEINNHGLTTVQVLKDLRYERLYRRETKHSERLEARTAELGWRTDQSTKRIMIDALAQAIREEVIQDFDPVFIRECMTYVVDERGITNAQEGCFDDTVMAKAVNLQVQSWSYVPQDQRQKATSYKPQKIAAAKARHRAKNTSSML